MEQRTLEFTVFAIDSHDHARPSLLGESYICFRGPYSTHHMEIYGAEGEQIARVCAAINEVLGEIRARIDDAIDF